MDNWRREKYSGVSKALKRIERREDKLSRRISDARSTHTPQDHQVTAWVEEIASLHDMSDRLLDFRGRLFFYSNVDYVEALNEWDYKVQKMCAKAQNFSKSSHHFQSSQRNETRRGENHQPPKMVTYQELMMLS